MKQYDVLTVRSAATSVNTIQIDLGDVNNYSYQVEFTGADVTGQLNLQVRDDSDYSWVTIPGAVENVVTSTNHIYNIYGAYYRYVRLTWTYTSGTGNIKIKAILKE